MAAAATAAKLPTSIIAPKLPFSSKSTHTLKFPFPKYTSPSLKTTSFTPPKTVTPHATLTPDSPISTPVFHGPCYVLADNIDTDQIIPAEHLTLVPSNPDEYQKLGSLALVGLPSDAYPIPFVKPESTTTQYPIIVAGANFGCGSSREHAPVALGAAGVRVVVAESYARIFFRNSVATGEVYPVESEGEDLWEECVTGDLMTVDLGEGKLVNHRSGKVYGLKPIGDAGPVIEAGGIFAYARKTGMIAAAAPE